MPWWLIMIIVIVVALAIMFVLYRVGDKLQKKQSAQREQMAEAAQPMNMLIIDKKMLPMKDAGLPKMVMEQTPKRYQKAKLPIAKVKVGPQIMNMICDDAIFDELPTRGRSQSNGQRYLHYQCQERPWQEGGSGRRNWQEEEKGQLAYTYAEASG